MDKKFWKNKAGNISSKKLVTMIVSILAVTMFIGSAIQPVIAVTLPNIEPEPREVEEECLPCNAPEPLQVNPVCKTCTCAVKFAVNYSINYVKTIMDNVTIPYLHWRMDVTLFILEGIEIGLKLSGFKVTIDKDELKENIEHWVNKSVGPQMHNITLFMATLSSIAIGITQYMLTLCGDSSQKTPDKQIFVPNLPVLSRIITIITRLILLIK